jgi:hypothetical protein
VIEALQKLAPWLAGLSLWPKILVSVVIISMAGFALAVIWSPQGSPRETELGASAWPAHKNLETLKAKLDSLSRTNGKLIRAIARADRHGLYVGDLPLTMRRNRHEMVYRAKELERQELLEVRPLTDLNLRLHQSIMEVAGSDARRFVAAYLS